MTKKELTVVIPIGDWEEEYLRGETDTSPAQMGRAVIVARERGDMEPDIILSNKTLLNIAAAEQVRPMLDGSKVVDYITSQGLTLDRDGEVVTVPPGTWMMAAKVPPGDIEEAGEKDERGE